MVYVQQHRSLKRRIAHGADQQQEQAQWETFHLISLLPWWDVSRGVIREYEERRKTRWRNETTTSLSPPTDAQEPTLRNSQALPLPPIRPTQPPRTRPVFEDACSGGLLSSHRITVWVTGLDTTVRCYPLIHILAGPFWLGQVSGKYRSAAYRSVQKNDKEWFRYGRLWCACRSKEGTERAKWLLVKILWCALNLWKTNWFMKCLWNSLNDCNGTEAQKNPWK